MARRKKRVELKIRLYPGQDDELIRWIASLNDLPWGGKSQRVKEALLRGISNDHSGEPTVTPAAFDLAEIRRVVEVATESALGRFGGQITVGDETQPVQPGSIVFVAAHVPHQFHDISEDLKILVFFAPPETS